jgi:hypothetical protein
MNGTVHVTAPARVAVTCRYKSGPPFGPSYGCNGCNGVTGKARPRHVTDSYLAYYVGRGVYRKGAISSSSRCPFAPVAVPFPGCRYIRYSRHDEAALDSVPGGRGHLSEHPPVKPFDLRRRTTHDREFRARKPRTAEATP